MLLLAADGMSNTEIADKVGVSRPTVLVWRKRYAEHGVDGLADLPRPGRRPRLGATEVLRMTLLRPPRRLKVTHWSSRVLAEELGVGRGTVIRAWRHYGLQPVHRGFRFATIPSLTGRVTAVLALRLGTPENLALLDVREPAHPVSSDDDEEASRALAALAAGLLRALPTEPADPTSALLGFLDEVNRARASWPTGSRLHLVTDGRGPVGLPALREALAVRSRISVHTVRQGWPDMAAAWLAMVGRGGGADAAAVAASVDRVRRALLPGEVYSWAHAPRPAGARRQRPSRGK